MQCYHVTNNTPMPKIISTLNLQLLNTTTKLAISTRNPLQELTSLLQQCSHVAQLNQVHAQMTKTGLVQQPPLAGKLIVSFASSGATSTARTIAGGVRGLNAFTWNTIMRGYLEQSDPESALTLYSHLRRKDLNLDSYSLLFAIKACSLMPAISLGKHIHADVLKLGFWSEGILQSAILHGYGVFGEIESMRQLFDEMPHRDVVAWNSLLSAYFQSNCPYEALEVSHAMGDDAVRLNCVTAVTLLSCCAALKAFREGKSVHGCLMRSLLSDLDVFVYNALIEMYSKCGSPLSAACVFHSMPQKTVVSWTSMINGYSNNNCLNEALTIFREMQSANVRPDEVTLLSVISVCSKLGTVELSDWIDHQFDRIGLGSRSIKLANALIGMHARCGNIHKACEIFNGMGRRTLVSWTAIIHGLAMHGHGMSALIRFIQMLREGLKPDGILFLSILFACSHSGLVEEGRECFNSMRREFGIEPWMEHYGCMVDLLCRAGLLNEAVEFVMNMPIKPDDILWRMLLRACHDHGQSNLGSQVMKRMGKLGTKSCENYMAMSNFSASVAEWDVVNNLREKMKAKGAVKLEPGLSLIEVDAN